MAHVSKLTNRPPSRARETGGCPQPSNSLFVRNGLAGAVDEPRREWGERAGLVAIVALLACGAVVIIGSLLGLDTLAFSGVGALLVAALVSTVLLYGTAPKRLRFQFGALAATVAFSLAGFLSFWSEFWLGALASTLAAIVAGTFAVTGGALGRALRHAHL